MSVTYGRVISLILTERFGPVVSSIGAFLFKSQSSPLLFIKRATNLPLSKIKESLCILIKYRLVTFKPNKNENLANYTLDSEKVLLMLRYPKYLNHIKRQFGDESEMIVEEILQRGYWSASELILKVHDRLSQKKEGPPTLSHIKDKLVYLVTAKYLQRLPYSQDERPVPNLFVQEHEMHLLPNIDIKTLSVYQKDSSVNLPDKNIYWTVNFDRFHQDMRDMIIVTAFTRKFDENAGEIIKLFLIQMYVRTEPWSDVSNPIPSLEIKDILKRQSNQSHALIFFDQYLSIIEQDNSKLLRKAGEASGGSYQIFLKEAFTRFTWELVEQTVLEKYDSKAARIFRLIKLKPYIEPDQIQQLAMIPAKDAKKLSYQLYEENFLHIQELRKTSSNNGPTKNFTLFHIQLENVVRMLLEMCYKALFNHITRRNHERDLNKRIIDKKQRVDTILMGMRVQGATEEQLSDIEEMITPPEKEILNNIEKIMKKLNTVELEKSYERKQYKNGLKFAKQILSNPKFQEHGETLAMKGLTLNCLGRKEEAYEYVRRGLRNDLKSHVCWHVYGLLQRSDKKYDEAIKCYRNALKWEKDNIQILRDLSLLQIQMRDLEGYRDTRYQLLMLRPTQRASWIGYAMSFHLLEDYKNALSILDTFLDQQQRFNNFDYEHSELLLYQNLVIQESGDLKLALKHLEKYSEQIVDRLTFKENLADLHLRVENWNKAADIYEELIQRNPENTIYYKKLIKAKRLTAECDIVDFYVKYAEKFPRAMPPKRLPLNYATGEQFRNLVDKYMRKALSKGVPPLFVDLRSLYKDAKKVQIIEELVLGYVESLKKVSKYSETESTNGPKEPASAILWVYYFLAQHYDHLKQTDKALEYIETAIEHTPTLIELFVTKGRIYKHAGDPVEAYQCLDEAQAMDTADRYINSKCAKYMLRANLIKEAEDTCAKFTREGVSAMENLNEMQCMWFQTECALAYQRLGKYGDALKKCHEIDRHFSEIIEDQFDFHTYCMRKMTLRSYVGLLRLEDVLRGHPFYFKAAKCSVEMYLHLFDSPLKDENAEQELNTENLAPSELKKLRNKQRRAKKKAEQESAQAREAQVKRDQHHKSRQQGDVEADAPQLDELIPDKLARVDDPLELAIKFLQPLQCLARDRIETHLMAFEVYYRKRKILLMLQSIKRAHQVDPSHPKLHSCLIRFLQVVKENQHNFDPAVSEVITTETKSLLKTKEPKTLNKEFLDSHRGSLRAALEGAIVMHQLDNKSQKDALSLVTNIDNNKYSDVDIEICTEVLKGLRNGSLGGCAQSQIDSFVAQCCQRFPHAVAFKPPKNVKAQQHTNHVSEQDSN